MGLFSYFPSLFADDIVLYTEKPKDSPKKKKKNFLRTNKWIHQIYGIQNQHSKINEQTEMESKKTIPLY